MFHEVEHEGADEVDGQHFHLEGRGQLGTVRDALAVRGPKLPGAVDRRRPHEIADGVNPGGVRLGPGRQPVDHMLEEAHAPVRPGEGQLRLLETASLLQGNIRREPVEVGRAGHSVEQREGGVPGRRDHPVGTLVVRQVMREGHKAIGPLGPARAVHRPSNSGRIERKDGPVELPPFPAQTPQQHSHERQAMLVKGPHPRQTHDFVRRPEGWPRHGTGAGDHEEEGVGKNGNRWVRGAKQRTRQSGNHREENPIPLRSQSRFHSQRETRWEFSP